MADEPRPAKYRRTIDEVQLGANTHCLIRSHVEAVADRLNVDRGDAYEIVNRVLDMIETGAERVGSRCPECGTICTTDSDKPHWRFGGMISVPVCPEHGGFVGGLVISFPIPDDVVIPPLPDARTPT